MVTCKTGTGLEDRDRSRVVVPVVTCRTLEGHANFSLAGLAG